MSGLRKTTIAKEAIRQLEGLYDIASEKIRRNWTYLHTQGWRA